MTKQNIYIVTSLPRTGTTSLCSMADTCNLKSLHVLKHLKFHECIDNGYNFFADTPFYSPEFLIGLLETNFLSKHNIKFIYSHKNYYKHKMSLNNFVNIKWKNFKSDLIIKNKTSLMDNINWNNIIQNKTYIKNHYYYIKNISKIYTIDMLDYDFKQGWDTFCSFINCTIPNIPLPHKNKT